ERARALAAPLMRQLREAVGLRSLAQAQAPQAAKAQKAALPQFKQYREADGKFYFKLLSASGQLLLQSTGYDAPKEAGQSIARLQQQGHAALAELSARLAPVDGVDSREIAQALEQLLAANA